MGTYQINFPDNQVSFKFREESLGDNGVIKQIFIDQDYDLNRFPNHARALSNFINSQNVNKYLVIDAGANIGAASVYFNNFLSNVSVFAIEPDPQNFDLLVANTLSYKNQVNYHGGISSIDGILYLQDPGHSDWGYRTSTEIKDIEYTIKVQSISPCTIISSHKELIPLIFKIDIEGGETELFSKNSEWIDLFPVVIIELHDWMLPFSGSSKSFIQTLSNYDFDILQHGENLFLFNRKILKDYAT